MRDRFVIPDLGPVDAERFTRAATIVLDTNVLLSLYQLVASARDETLAALAQVADRTRIPDQVGREFYRNLPKVRGRLATAYDDVAKGFRSASGVAMGKLSKDARSAEARSEVQALLDQATKFVEDGLIGLAQKHGAHIPEDDDPVERRLNELFGERVLPRPDAATVRSRVEEFTTWRLPNEIPPGFDDASNKTGPLRQAGDYLIWCEVLDLAAQVDTPVLLVTNDVKKDWYEGDDLPRAELVREFAEHSPAGYHQVRLDTFLRLVRDHLGATVKDETVASVAAAQAEEALAAWLETLAARNESDEQWSVRRYLEARAGVPADSDLRAVRFVADYLERNGDRTVASIAQDLRSVQALDPAQADELARVAAGPRGVPLDAMLRLQAAADADPHLAAAIREARDAGRDPAVRRAMDAARPQVRDS